MYVNGKYDGKEELKAETLRDRTNRESGMAKAAGTKKKLAAGLANGKKIVSLQSKSCIPLPHIPPSAVSS